MQKLIFKELLEAVFGTQFQSMKQIEIISYLLSKSKTLEEIWKKSNYTDFSIYQHPDYIYDMFVCYHFVSKASITNMLSYFKKNNITYTDFTYLDDYNGVGLTTLHLLNEIKAKNIFFFNNNQEQISTFKKLCEKYKFDFPANEYDSCDSSNKYDVVISLETAEHYKEPLEYAKQLVKKTNKYLIYSSGFNKLFPGHFPTYTIQDEYVLFSKKREVSIKTAGRIVNKYLKDNLDLVYKGWNGKPTIYRKKNL